MFKSIIKLITRKYIMNLVAKPEFKNNILDAVNKRVDIPKLDENQERDLFASIYDAIIGAII